MSKERENIIREKRIYQATQRGYIGGNGKIMTLLKSYGKPIITDKSEFTTQNDDSRVLEYHYTYECGYYYNAMHLGRQIEIIHFLENDTLQLIFKSDVVYKEVEGELVCYIPNNEWEDFVNNMYKTASAIIDKRKEKKEKNMLQKIYENNKRIMERIKSLWGEQ